MVESAPRVFYKLCHRKHGYNRRLFDFFLLSEKYFFWKNNKNNGLDLSRKLFGDRDDFDSNYNDISNNHDKKQESMGSSTMDNIPNAMAICKV